MTAMESIPRPENTETIPLPNAYFEAYREANLRFPMRAQGIATFIAALAVSDFDFDPTKFATMELSEE